MKRRGVAVLFRLTVFLGAGGFCLSAAHAQRSVEPHGPAQATRTPRVVRNPYGTVRWETVTPYLANLHSHTLYSDGRAEPGELIHAYAAAGYDILAITDHDNYHQTREGERPLDPTPETTWPWTGFLDARPSRVWTNNDVAPIQETSALFPSLGRRGMLAIRGNELSQHPHIVSLFSSCGWIRKDLCEHARIQTVGALGGLSYWTHPDLYGPDGYMRHAPFDRTCWDETIRYFGRFLEAYDHHVGIELVSLGRRREQELALLDRLLAAYLERTDILIYGSDDNHQTTVADDATYSIVLAEELTEESVRHALEHGHVIVGYGLLETYPAFRSIRTDEENLSIVLDIEPFDQIRWIKNGRTHGTGPVFEYSGIEHAVLRFEVDYQAATFYSQAFLIQSP